jgi:hypothetical protein
MVDDSAGTAPLSSFPVNRNRALNFSFDTESRLPSDIRVRDDVAECWLLLLTVEAARRLLYAVSGRLAGASRVGLDGVAEEEILGLEGGALNTSGMSVSCDSNGHFEDVDAMLAGLSC